MIGEVPTRPADKAVRRATLRRVARLFKPYRLRLGALLFLILVSALMGVVPAFLLRRVINDVHRPPVLALTATATPAVRRDILTQLGIEDTPQVVFR